MTMNDKPLTRNYDSDKEKSEIDSDNPVLKIRQQCILAEEIAFYNKVKLSVTIDSLLCYYCPKLKCFGDRITRMHLHYIDISCSCLGRNSDSDM